MGAYAGHFSHYLGEFLAFLNSRVRDTALQNCFAFLTLNFQLSLELFPSLVRKTNLFQKSVSREIF